MIAGPGNPPAWRPRRVVVTPHAERDLKKLTPDVRARIAAALARYARTGAGDVKALVGRHPPQRRLRVGDYRVVLGVPGADTPDDVPVLAVRNRREAC